MLASLAQRNLNSKRSSFLSYNGDKDHYVTSLPSTTQRRNKYCLLGKRIHLLPKTFRIIQNIPVSRLQK